ncbi:hypothetical protein EBME_0962 [bacterium endosymbiont of Mortierella elongata FMR23-6]|nr:hypothetical protein EBME_0962 [bacterium endosymbiont of Mortierella elongata FMR23-6]
MNESQPLTRCDEAGFFFIIFINPYKKGIEYFIVYSKNLRYACK